jgi:hypothetical protein
MTMGDVHKVPPPDGIYPQLLSSDDFHPEFGYLCPTPRMRLKLRMIAILALIGTMIGAISVLAPLHREGGENDRSELVLSVAMPTTDQAAPMTLPSPSAVTDASSILHGLVRCQDLLGLFINHQCESDNFRSRSARRRVDPHQIISRPIGHGSLVSANEPTVSEPKAVMSEKSKVIGNVTDIARASAAGLVDPSTPNTKPHIKSARKHRQTTPSDHNGLSAFAAAPWFGSNAHARKATPFGSGGWGAWR